MTTGLVRKLDAEIMRLTRRIETMRRMRTWLVEHPADALPARDPMVRRRQARRTLAAAGREAVKELGAVVAAIEAGAEVAITRTPQSRAQLLRERHVLRLAVGKEGIDGR